MKKKLLLILTFFCFYQIIAQNNVHELDSVTIFAKIPVSKKNTGKISVEITNEMLENSKGKSLSQILSNVTGIEINGSRGNEGQNLGYFVRGGRNRQVVILIDGIQVSDPSDISNGFDLRLIPANGIERIEIIKGASSVLYGSGAGTAVINIIMKPAAKESISGSLTISAGSNTAAEKNDSEHTIEHFMSHATVNGTINRFFYSATFNHRYVDGLSAVAANEGEERFESDLFERINSRVSLGYHLSKNITINRFFSLDRFKTGFDDFTYMDADNLSTNKLLRTGGKFEWKFSKGSLVVNDSHSWIDREVESSYPARFDSYTFTMDSYLTYNMFKGMKALIGFNVNSSSFNSYSIPFGETDFSQYIDDRDAKFGIVDPYFNVVFNSTFGMNITAGLRLNNHSNYDSHLVYSINPSYIYEFNTQYLKVLTSMNSAYITPSLYQLYDPFYGNEELMPEENTTFEFGIEYAKAEDYLINVVLFNREEKNFVDFILVDPVQFLYTYQNRSDAFNTSGFEVELSKNIGSKLQLRSNYTNTQVDENFKNRIPEHKANIYAKYQFDVNTSISIGYQYNSDRSDEFFNPDTFERENVTLGSYQLWDLQLNSRIMKNLYLFINVNNILNEEYEEVYRYQTLGRNITAGITFDF